MKKIAPCLWFDGQAEEAAKLYTSLFPGSRIVSVSRYGDAGPGPKRSVMTVQFRLAGQDFIALNGGPQYRFTEAFSLQIACEEQAEVDRLWSALSDGGSEGRCGWLKDRWGMSWQIVPRRLHELLADANPDRARRAMEAMLRMSKLNITELERAADGS